MRGTRWLLLVAIAAIVGGIAVTYRAQRSALEKQAPAKPKALPADLNSSAEHWHWEQTESKEPFRKTRVIDARNFRQVKDTSRVELEGVEVRAFHKDGDVYDLVKSAAASFQATERRLYSDGEVEITLAVPVNGQPTSDLVSIKSSGVTFDSDSGKAETDRPSTFVFRNGDGKSKGAIYDPTVHSLEMKSEVEIHWKAPKPGAKPIKIESGALNYYEDKSEIWLRPWGRVTRENSVIEGQDVIIHLKDGVMQNIVARQAHGTDTYPKRKISYQADDLWVDFNEDGQVKHILGQTNAQLVSDSEGSLTTVNARKVDLDFAANAAGDSLLTAVRAEGDSVVDSKPKPLPGRTLAERHVLRSDKIDMAMRDGGREMDRVVTRTPGTLEFIPSIATQHHRRLESAQMTIQYGAENQIETYRASTVKTITDPTAEEKKRNRAVAITTSKELLAKFEPKSSRLTSIEQWGDFAYDEGDRKARAAKGTLDAAVNMVHLETNARVWDPTGSTSADRIHMNQNTGDFTAEGRVNSSRIPEKKKSSEMLSGDEPLQAQAQKMDSTKRNRVIHYAGGVVMWQGANRITGDVVDIDREKRTLVAAGNVVSSLWEQPKSNEPAPKDGKAPAKKAAAQKSTNAAPILTVVRAPNLVYTEENRLAYYTGGVHLTRPGLDVKSRELRAWLSESGSDSSLDKAFADGQVVIVQTAPDRTRNGTGEHGEYYTADQKIVLRGGEPQLIDSQRGRTQGRELTYFANDDRLLVNGVADRPASSVIHKKK